MHVVPAAPEVVEELLRSKAASLRRVRTGLEAGGCWEYRHKTCKYQQIVQGLLSVCAEHLKKQQYILMLPSVSPWLWVQDSQREPLLCLQYFRNYWISRKVVVTPFCCPLLWLQFQRQQSSGGSSRMGHISVWWHLGCLTMAVAKEKAT